MVQNGKRLVQEGALTALASVADSAQVIHLPLNRSTAFNITGMICPRQTIGDTSIYFGMASFLR